MASIGDEGGTSGTVGAGGDEMDNSQNIGSLAASILQTMLENDIGSTPTCGVDDSTVSKKKGEKSGVEASRGDAISTGIEESSAKEDNHATKSFASDVAQTPEEATQSENDDNDNDNAITLCDGMKRSPSETLLAIGTADSRPTIVEDVLNDIVKSKSDVEAAKDLLKIAGSVEKLKDHLSIQDDHDKQFDDGSIDTYHGQSSSVESKRSSGANSRLSGRSRASSQRSISSRLSNRSNHSKRSRNGDFLGRNTHTRWAKASGAVAGPAAGPGLPKPSPRPPIMLRIPKPLPQQTRALSSDSVPVTTDESDMLDPDLDYDHRQDGNVYKDLIAFSVKPSMRSEIVERVEEEDRTGTPPETSSDRPGEYTEVPDGVPGREDKDEQIGGDGNQVRSGEEENGAFVVALRDEPSSRSRQRQGFYSSSDDDMSSKDGFYYGVGTRASSSPERRSGSQNDDFNSTDGLALDDTGADPESTSGEDRVVIYDGGVVVSDDDAIVLRPSYATMMSSSNEEGISVQQMRQSDGKDGIAVRGSSSADNNEFVSSGRSHDGDYDDGIRVHDGSGAIDVGDGIRVHDGSDGIRVHGSIDYDESGRTDYYDESYNSSALLYESSIQDTRELMPSRGDRQWLSANLGSKSSKQEMGYPNGYRSQFRTHTGYMSPRSSPKTSPRTSPRGERAGLRLKNARVPQELQAEDRRSYGRGELDVQNHSHHRMESAEATRSTTHMTTPPGTRISLSGYRDSVVSPRSHHSAGHAAKVRQGRSQDTRGKARRHSSPPREPAQDTRTNSEQPYSRKERKATLKPAMMRVVEVPERRAHDTINQTVEKSRQLGIKKELSGSGRHKSVGGEPLPAELRLERKKATSGRSLRTHAQHQEIPSHSSKRHSRQSQPHSEHSRHSSSSSHLHRNGIPKVIVCDTLRTGRVSPYGEKDQIEMDEFEATVLEDRAGGRSPRTGRYQSQLKRQHHRRTRSGDGITLGASASLPAQEVRISSRGRRESGDERLAGVHPRESAPRTRYDSL